jgi:hypothetical protein
MQGLLAVANTVEWLKDIWRPDSYLLAAPFSVLRPPGNTGANDIFYICRDYQLLPIEWLKDIWRPDSYFKNAKRVTFQVF